MYLVGNLIWHLMLVLNIIMSIVFLTSCVSDSPPILNAPISSVSRESQLSLPQNVPYESYPGEAANVQKMLDSIKDDQHNDIPQPSVSSSIYPHQSGYPARLIVTNETECKLGVYFQGPILREFKLEISQSTELDITAGSYQFGVDTHLCIGEVTPLFGEIFFKPRNSYTLTLLQESIQVGIGNFIVENNTGAKLIVQIGDTTHTVKSGTSSIELAEGSYTAKVSSECGTRKDTFNITKGSTYTGKYWCSKSKIVTQLPEVGYFIVENKTNTKLTVRIGSKTYKVQPGSTTIELPEGSYDAKVSAKCGSTNEHLEIKRGSRYKGSYSCVSR